MTDRPRYPELQHVLLDASFPELDLELRKGRHIDRDDLALYTLLVDAQDHLEAFYRRYGCDLVHKADGYFYLLPTGEKLSRRQLGAGDMLVGQALALMYLDPATIERGGRATTEDVVAQLVVVLGSDALIRAFNPKRKRYDERVAQKTVRNKVAEGIRHLAALGFVDLDDENLRLRPALLRFAEPVRGLSAPAEALAKLVASGEVSLVTDADADGDADIDADADADAEADLEDEHEHDPHVPAAAAAAASNAVVYAEPEPEPEPEPGSASAAPEPAVAEPAVAEPAVASLIDAVADEIAESDVYADADSVVEIANDDHDDNDDNDDDDDDEDLDR